MPLPNYFFQILQKQYQRYLFDDFLPYLKKFIVDKEYGGFLCHTDRKGHQVSIHKRTWYDGREIWMYSFLYEHLDQKKGYLRKILNGK